MAIGVSRPLAELLDLAIRITGLQQLHETDARRERKLPYAAIAAAAGRVPADRFYRRAAYAGGAVTARPGGFRFGEKVSLSATARTPSKTTGSKLDAWTSNFT